MARINKVVKTIRIDKVLDEKIRELAKDERINMTQIEIIEEALELYIPFLEAKLK